MAVKQGKSGGTITNGRPVELWDWQWFAGCLGHGAEGRPVMAMRRPVDRVQDQVRVSAILAELHGGDERSWREDAERVATLRASMVSRDWAGCVTVSVVDA
jgi:hypothetical protein